MADIIPSMARGTVWSNTLDQLFTRAFYPSLNRAANGATANVSGTAYFVYVGYVGADQVFQGITLQQAAIQGAGAQTAEVCFASTPSAPNRANQTLTRIGAGDGALSSLTAGTSALIRPGAAMNTLIPGGTFLWCGFRQAMATTQAGFECVFDDMGQGSVLRLAASGALTATTTFAGTIATFSDAAQAPFMIATFD